MPPHRLRNVIYSPRFDRQLAEFEGNVRRLDEQVRAIEFAVAHEPGNGQITANPDIWAWPTTGSAWNVDPIVIYYSIPDDEHVVFEAITRATLEP